MNSSNTKLRRRMRKYQNIIKKDCGLNLSQLPTKILMICNGGLVNGLGQELVLEKFNIFGEIENIVMIPQKSYCFLVFKEVVTAEVAYVNLNNKEIWPVIKGPIYLGFIEKIPENFKININFQEKPFGLFIIEEFITEMDETQLLSWIKAETTEGDEIKASELKHRRVSHFGYEFNYFNNNVNPNEPIKKIPEELDFIWDKVLRMSSELGLVLNHKPDQLTINNYQPGQGIPPHVDTHSAFEDAIFSLSLQSSVIMDFKNVEGKCCSVWLPARSLCIISGEARYGWTHGIANRKSDIIPNANGSLSIHWREERTSLTFRKIKQRDCHCEFPHYCDTRKKAEKESSANLQEVASKLEKNYVHEVYQKIYGHFSETRHKPWPNVLKFVQSFPLGSILVDVGCGNGKYFIKNSERFEIGLDASLSLMKVCKERGFECATANCLQIPIKDNIADGCISIAVIHHLATEERRKKAITEIIRILKPKGRALIYVWARDQERLNKKSSYLKKNTQTVSSETANSQKVILNDIKSNLMLPVHTNRTDFIHNDVLVPWKLKDKSLEKNLPSDQTVFLRYYHVFQEDELSKLCSCLSNCLILDYYYDQGNWCVVLQKCDA